MRVTKRFSFASGHRLLNYEGPCANIHGHNYVLEVTIAGEPNKLQMVMDFKDLKTAVKTYIDAAYDHRLLLHEDDPLIHVLDKYCSVDVTVFESNPTAEFMADRILMDLRRLGLNVVHVRLYETEDSYAEISY